MKNENRNFKQEIKDFWDTHGEPIKVGAKWLAIGLLVGFVKGVLTESKISGATASRLIDKIPYEPDCDDIAEYVHDHIDELKPYIETEMTINE